MQDPQQHLPVPATQVLQNQFVSGHQMPAMPNIPEVGSLPQQEVANLHMALIMTLQNLASKSPIRTFMANLFSQYQYANRGYAELLAATIDYYMVLKYSNQGDVNRCATLVLDGYIPKIVDEFPALLGYLTPQQQQDMNTLRGLRQQMGEQVAQFMYAQQGGGYAQPSGYPPQHGGYQQPGGYPSGPGGHPGHHPGGPEMNFGPGGYSGAPRGPAMYPQQHGGYPQMSGGGGRPTGAWGSAGNRGAAPTRSGGPSASSMLNQGSSGAPQQSGGGSRRPVVGGIHNTTDRFAPTPNEEEQGVEMKHVTHEDRQLGHLSAVREVTPVAPAIDREVTFVSNAYIPVRRHDQKIVTTEKDGRQQWGVVDLEETDMEYSQHETNPKMTTLARDNTVGPKVGRPAHWDEVSVPNEVSSDDPKKGEGEGEGEDAFKDDTAIILKDSVMAYSFAHGRSLAIAQADVVGVHYSPDRVFEYYVDLMTPVGDTVTAEQVQKLRETSDLSHMVTVLSELAEEMDSRLWYQLHDRLTAVFNRRMNGGIGQGGFITSLTDDYNASMGIISTKYSVQAVDTFKRNTHAACLRTINLREANGKTLISESISVTELPWSSADIDLVMESTFCMLSAAVNNYMTGAVLQLFTRTNQKDCLMNRRYLVTTDNVVIELHRGDMGQDTFLISKAEICC